MSESIFPARLDTIPVSCLVYTLNEEVNLPHCLASLAWCDDVVVVDSFSTDATARMAHQAGVRFVQHAFSGFGDQRNWSLATIPLRHQWAFILDADECIPPAMVAELADRLAHVPDEVAAFRVRRRFYLWGKWLRYSSLYPTWVVRLVRVGRVCYVNRGHAETQVVEGKTEALTTDLLDENHKGIAEWWERQQRYALQEARYEWEQAGRPWRWRELFAADPLTRRAAQKQVAGVLPGRAVWYFLYTTVVRGGVLDGWAGVCFCAMKARQQGWIARAKRQLQREAKRRACVASRES